MAVLVPVLDRPHRVGPLVESARAAARFIPCPIVFIATEGDTAELAAIEAVLAHDVRLLTVPPALESYPFKINYGFAHTEDEFVLTGADDLVFHPGWIERALACHLETHACVIGTNDEGNSRVMAGNHSTHTLVHRDYGACGTIDEPESGKLLHDGYSHSFVDVEFCETAMMRETWAHASDSLVEHEHYLWGKAPRDATYDRGQSSLAADQALFKTRQPLWGGA